MARAIDARALENKISEWLGQPGNGDYYSGYDAALCAVQDLIADMPTLTPPNEPRMINADKLAKRIAGHSNYHGDSILAAIYCAAEGKENDAPIRPIETPPNEWVSVEDDGGENNRII